MENKVFEFIEKWLPDYQERLENFKSKKLENGGIYTSIDEEYFILDQFDEAKENFAKAQREMCIKEIKNNFDLYGDSVDAIFKLIKNAPMP